MRQRRTSRRSGLTAILIVGLGALATVGLTWANGKWHHSVPPGEKYELADVRRTDLYPALTASGRVESSKRTLIECELENITIGVMGQRFTAGRCFGAPERGSRGVVRPERRCPGGARLLGLRRAPPPATDDRRAVEGRPPSGASSNHEIAKLAVNEFQEG